MFRGPIPGKWLPSRRALLFLAAIGLPCLLLVGLSLRMLTQERELAEKRLADDRRRVAAEIRQELLSRLDELRLEALTTHPSGGLQAPSGTDAIVLVARIERDHLTLPWDELRATAAVAAALNEPAFAALIRAGERRELLDQRFDAAVDQYNRAAARARAPSQTAFARLLAARALAKSSRVDEARDIYRRLLDTPPDVIDEQGVPFALYAARRLLDAPARRDTELPQLLDALRATCTKPSVATPATTYMCSDLVAAANIHAAAGPTQQATQELARQLASARRDLEQALALQKEFPSVRARTTAAARPARDVTWVPFGPPDAWWLVGVGTSPADTSVVAVRAAPLIASQESVRTALRGGNAGRLRAVAVASDGEPLGADVPGIVAAFEPAGAEMLSAGSIQRSFYLAALALVVSMAVVGAYLFWRDVQREVRVAATRSQFVSSVSHELKTPLTAIRMFAETLLLSRSTRPDVREEYLHTIVNESERLTRLLNNVLDFSNIEQGRKSYRIEPHSLADIVRIAARAMAYTFSQQGFELRLAIADNMPDVPADPDAIQQAILNLLSNAMKYSADGRIVDLRLTTEGGHAVISVVDRGIGIPLAEQERVFEKFYRVRGDEYDRIPGTGLGLTLVDHIVKGHRGAVTITSAPGEGSTFSIRLPMARIASGAPDAEEALA